MKKKLKILTFVILSVVFYSSYGQSSKNIVNSSVNLNVGVGVINDSIRNLREDFETYKATLKAEYDSKIDAVNQENDGRYQVLGFCASLVLTLLLAVLVYFKIDANDKIKSGIVVAFDEKFEKDKKKIELIRDEATEILTQIKEIQTSALLEKGKINDIDIIDRVAKKISNSKKGY